MRSSTHTRTTSAYLLTGGTVAGLALIMTGSFLPWSRSGSVTRNSYESAGLAGHFTLVDNEFLAVVLRAWIAIPAAAVVVIALIALRLDRLGAALALVIGTPVGTVAGMLTVQATDPAGLVGIAPAGPATSLGGSIITLIGAIGVLVAAGRIRGSAQGRAGTHS